MARKQEYGNESITSLKGADRVRKRPAVIFGSDGVEGCAHSIFEIVSNSIDEAREGHGDTINVTRFARTAASSWRTSAAACPWTGTTARDVITGSCCSASCTQAASTAKARITTSSAWV